MIKSEIFICPICKKEFVLEGRKLKDAKQNIKNGKAGPFCCKRCAGIYGKRVQIGINENRNICSLIFFGFAF